MKYLFFIFILLLGCTQSSKKNDLSTLKEEVLLHHDKAMSKMGLIQETRKKLLIQADSLVSIDNKHTNSLVQIADALKKIDTRMMEWMRNYDPEFDATDDEKYAYFDQQKKEIKEIDEGIDLLIKYSDTTLKKK